MLRDGTIAQCRQHRGNHHQQPTSEDQAQSYKLIHEVMPILSAVPTPIERHFQRLKDSTGSEEKQYYRDHLHLALRCDRNLEVAVQKMAEGVREIVVQREIDRV